MKSFGQYRELAASGASVLSAVPVLLADFKSGAGPAREFRTTTLAGAGLVPPLSAVAGDPATRVAPLEKSSRNPYVGFLFVGRASTCDVILRDASISKSHAVIEPVDGEWLLRDNRSRNGTFLNGGRLAEGQRAVLTSGDLVVLGSYPVYFVSPPDLLRLARLVISRPPPRA